MKIDKNIDWKKVKEDREYYAQSEVKQEFKEIEAKYKLDKDSLTEIEAEKQMKYLMWYCHSPKLTPEEIFEGIECNQVWEYDGEYHVINSYNTTLKDDGTFDSLTTMVYSKSTGKDRTCAFHPMTLEWMPMLKEHGKLVGKIGEDFCILNCGCEYLINIKDWNETISSYATRKRY